MHRVLVGIATYNEIQNLPSLVDQVLCQLPTADLLIVDDNSPDGTGAWCRARAAVDSRVHCLTRTGKLGLGTAVLETMRYAIAHDYGLLVNMDADFSHPPRYLPQLVAGMDVRQQPVVDVVIGSRYVAGGRVAGWPVGRRLMSRLVNCYARWALWLPCRDCSGSFRCYRTDRLSQLDFTRVRSRGYSFFEEILWHLRQAGARMAEIPIEFTDRQRGRSKISVGEAAAALVIISLLGVRTWVGPGQRGAC